MAGQRKDKHQGYNGQYFGLPEPKLIDFDGDFRVNMYRRIENELAPDDRVTEKVTEKVTNRVTEKEKRILDLLSENPELTMVQMAEKLHVSRKTITVRIKSLKEKDRLEHIGSTRKGYWKVK